MWTLMRTLNSLIVLFPFYTGQLCDGDLVSSC